MNIVCKIKILLRLCCNMDGQCTFINKTLNSSNELFSPTQMYAEEPGKVHV